MSEYLTVAILRGLSTGRKMRQSTTAETVVQTADNSKYYTCTFYFASL